MLNLFTESAAEEKQDLNEGLEKLFNSLKPLKDIQPYLYNRIGLEARINHGVLVGIMINDKKARKKILHHAFMIYDADKPVSERHIADNGKFISALGHPVCYRLIKEFLQAQGYVNFHNPYLDYVEKRFRDYIASSK